MRLPEGMATPPGDVREMTIRELVHWARQEFPNTLLTLAELERLATVVLRGAPDGGPQAGTGA